MNETEQPDSETIVAKRDAERSGGAWATFWRYFMIAVRWTWIITRWASLKLMDISLWLILSLTKNSRAIRPTIRATFSKRERAEIAADQRYMCMYCGVGLTTANLQIDHMHPVSRGGSNDYANLQALCRRCNVRKGNHTDREFRERYERLVGYFRQPPQQRIPQSYFDDIMHTTEAHEGVKQANRNRYMTPRQRLRRALPMTVFFWMIVFIVVSIYWLPSLGAQMTILGIVFGVVYAAGLWLRARRIGVLEEEPES